MAGKRGWGEALPRNVAVVAALGLLAGMACGGGETADPGGTGGTGGGSGGSGGDAPRYGVEGTVSGLAGTGLVLQLNDQYDLPIALDGAFAFPAVLEFGTRYLVTVASQPTGLSQDCTVEGETGVIGTSDAVGVAVTCVTRSFHVGVAVSGLASEGLELALNGGPTLPIDTDGEYTFPTPLADGSDYEVTVAVSPESPSQTCAIADASGRLDGADLSLQVTCATDTFTVGGTVGGLRGTGLVLRLNGGDDLEVTRDGSFAFPTPLPDLSSYRVEVFVEPAEPAQRCALTGGEGQLDGADITSVRITCANLYTLGGTVSGLAAEGLVLALNDSQELAITADGPFVFPAPLVAGTDYIVTVAQQPNDQVCKVTLGSGRIFGDYHGVAVSCATLYSISGTVSGLEGTLTLRIPPSNSVTVTADGPFTFPQQLPANSSFTVQLAAVPERQVCRIAGGQGTLTADYDGVAVTCEEETFTVTVNVTNLWYTAGSLVLTLNGVQNLPVHANGPITFPIGLHDGDAYSVTVTSQPSWDEYCYTSYDSGVIARANVYNVEVYCYLIY